MRLHLRKVRRNRPVVTSAQRRRARRALGALAAPWRGIDLGVAGADHTAISVAVRKPSHIRTLFLGRYGPAYPLLNVGFNFAEAEQRVMAHLTRTGRWPAKQLNPSNRSDKPCPP